MHEATSHDEDSDQRGRLQQLAIEAATNAIIIVDALAPDRPIFWFSACSILRRSHEQASTPFDVDVGDVLAIRGPKRSNET